MPHATSCGLDWPFTPKRREKKPTASSRRRSHRTIELQARAIILMSAVNNMCMDTKAGVVSWARDNGYTGPV
jgi:hypothetical protein